jgi:hypothetical protein
MVDWADRRFRNPYRSGDPVLTSFYFRPLGMALAAANHASDALAIKRAATRSPATNHGAIVEELRRFASVSSEAAVRQYMVDVDGLRTRTISMATLSAMRPSSLSLARSERPRRCRPLRWRRVRRCPA